MVMRFEKILKIIGEAGKSRETVRIFYPETDERKEGWREVEPYSITTDLLPDGEFLVYKKDHIRPGHILNAYNMGSGENESHSFILGKIKAAKKTGRSFDSRKKWEVRF